MELAFEYYMDADYDFNTPFQAQLAEYLSAEYMEYINAQELSVEEAQVGFDLNKDGDQEDNIALTIEYDLEKYPETNGYYGSYLDLYLAEFTQNLQWYLDSLDYAEDWTWFDEEGNALNDEAVASMTSSDKAQAFMEGRYAKGSTGGKMGMGFPGGGDMPDGFEGGFPGGGKPGEDGQKGGRNGGEMPKGADAEEGMETDGAVPDKMAPNGMPGDGANEIVGTPDSGTTQSAGSAVDSSNYESYEEMVAAYKADIEEISEGDRYGNNQVSLYNPLEYIGAEGTENPVWTKIVMGASEGDMSMFASLNLQIAWQNAGVDAELEWQWDGGHVPSEVLGNSFSLYVDQMYGEYVENAVTVTKAEAVPQTVNGTAEQATGKDISGWVTTDEDNRVSFMLADAVSYRTAGASKATPGFDVLDYGQEDYVFGSREKDARHWDAYLLEIFEKYADVLEPLFNNAQGN